MAAYLPSNYQRFPGSIGSFGSLAIGAPVNPLTFAFGGQGGGGGGGGGGIQITPTLQSGQQNILSQGSALLSQLMGGSGGYNPFLPLSAADTSNWWNQYMRPSAEQQFQERTLPATREAYVGPGTYWGGARADAEARARQGFENEQSQQIGNYFMQSKQLANQALLPFALGLLNANTGIATGQQQQQGGVGGGLGEFLMQLLRGQQQPQQRQAQPQMQTQGGYEPVIDYSQRINDSLGSGLFDFDTPYNFTPSYDYSSPSGLFNIPDNLLDTYPDLSGF